MNHLEDAGRAFAFASEPTEYVRCNEGHINDTYFVKCGGSSTDYVLQRVNISVFTKPDELMENIVNVTEFLKKKVAAEGGDTKRCVRTIIPTKTGSNYYIDESGGYWRSFLSIPDVVSYSSLTSPELFYHAAQAFGHFFMQMSDYPACTLHETINDFHNTPMRMLSLEKAAEKDTAGRKDSVRHELDFLLSRKKNADYITTRLADGRYKLRVTHNDTKINNILMDEKTGLGVCIIDLDTVMPGSILYDFGDAIRSGAASAAEDEKDLSKVFFRLDYYRAFLKGFIDELRETLSREEIKGLSMGAYLMTFESAVRFLTDYLNGDTYFRIEYPEHNLVRARNQIRLTQDLEDKMTVLDEMAAEYSEGI